MSSRPYGKTGQPIRRRWCQYSLRTLLAVMLLASIGMSCLGVKLQHHRRQREAAEVIGKAGGRLSEHLAGLMALVTLSIRGSAITDEGLAHFASLTNLEDLSLTSTRVGSAGLARLEDMPNLESLSLEYTNVTDAGLRRLARLPKLAWIGLEGDWVTAEGCAGLATATSCEIRR